MNEKKDLKDTKVERLSFEEQNKLRGGSPPRMIIPPINPFDGD